jgi:hypothetical protein
MRLAISLPCTAWVIVSYLEDSRRTFTDSNNAKITPGEPLTTPPGIWGFPALFHDSPDGASLRAANRTHCHLPDESFLRSDKNNVILCKICAGNGQTFSQAIVAIWSARIVTEEFCGVR